MKAAIDVWLRPALPELSETLSNSPLGIAPPADLNVLAELIGDDPEVMLEVLQTFRANTLRLALEIAQAQAGGAIPVIAGIAHQLKSAARTIGAERLGQICADIEDAANSNPRGETLGPMLAAFDSELRTVYHFLGTRLDGDA